MEARKHKPGAYVLQTSSGEVLRVLNWKSNAKTFVVKRHITGRIELSTFDAIKPEDTRLAEVSKEQVRRASVSITDDVELAHIASVFHTEKNGPVAGEDKQEQKFGAILRVTGVAHVGVVLLCLLLGMVIEPWLQPEETIVKIVPQKKVTRPKVNKTVKVSDTKINRKRKVTKRKVTRNSI